MLKDFRGWIVQAIVNFMYRGEISVPQEKLQQLIQAGESLQVRGLIDHHSITALSVADSSDQDFNVSLTSTPALSPQPPFNIDPNSDICISPMPRRKQARPRRRSGDCEPQDLSNGLHIAKCEDELLLSDTEADDEEIDQDDTELVLIPPSKRLKQNDNNNNQSMQNGSNHSPARPLPTPVDNDNEKENKPHASDSPENLCTKNSNKLNEISESNPNQNESKASSGEASGDHELGQHNDKNNNSANGKEASLKMKRDELQDRFILSLKDIRHLNRTYRPPPNHHQHPHSHHFNEILSHIPLSPPTPPFHNNHMGIHPHHQQHRHSHENQQNLRINSENHKEKSHMKIETDRSDDDSPIMEQIDLSIPSHPAFGGNVSAAVAAFEREHSKQKNKEFLMNSANLNFPPPFHQDGRHTHPSSPLSFPSMPSVSSLALTPPHSK